MSERNRLQRRCWPGYSDSGFLSLLHVNRIVKSSLPSHSIETLPTIRARNYSVLPMRYRRLRQSYHYSWVLLSTNGSQSNRPQLKALSLNARRNV